MRTKQPRGTSLSDSGRLAELQIRERVEQAGRSRLVSSQGRGRHRLAEALHGIADRLDG